MTIEKRLEYVTGLANERAELQVRLAQIDDELRELLGMDKADKRPEPKKPRGGGASGKKAKPEPEGRECGCGPRGRHKRECTLNDGKLPPDTAPLKWECLECSNISRSEEKPDKCDCGGKTFIQR